VSAAQWNVFRSPQGADTGGHRSGLCLRGHHPYRLGVCRVSEVSKCSHTLQTPFTYREPVVYHIPYCKGVMNCIVLLFYKGALIMLA